MPAYFGMTLKELIAVKHPTAWMRFEKGETTQEDLFRDFFKDGRSFDHQRFLAAVVISSISQAGKLSMKLAACIQ